MFSESGEISIASSPPRVARTSVVGREVSVAEIRSRLAGGCEIALLDVREEGAYAESHPLFAASLPLSRLELEVFDRMPRKNAPIVVYDDGEGLSATAVKRLTLLGYTDVGFLKGGLSAWSAAGAELFRDVNVPSKAFGELVEARRHTPSIGAEELAALVKSGEDLVILDARRFEEFCVMSIPSATSVPGGELVLRAPELAPDPATMIVVNCAGRTRSIIGTQSLINAGVRNRVAALRNGTIGWTLAGLPLDHGQTRSYATQGRGAEGGVVATRVGAARAARRLADAAGASRITAAVLEAWSADTSRTLYRFDVRTPREYATGHLPGFRSAPGGQLVQETDYFAPVRGARIVLADDDGVRANMTASWLAQMGWDVSILSDASGAGTAGSVESGPFRPSLPPLPEVNLISAVELESLLGTEAVTVIDLCSSGEYAEGHVPGAWFALRSQLGNTPSAVWCGVPCVLVSSDDALARFAAVELEALTGMPPRVLAGGMAAWRAQGRPLETGHCRSLSPAIDRYKRPYEGTDNPTEALQAYLEWEFGLVDQLERDNTHHFRVL
jgi:rhodanese-related sulfurtransferase